MTKPIKPSILQQNSLQEICNLVEQRNGRRVKTTLELLRQAGYKPQWQRVIWTGGVGSYRWMPRRRKFRILVAATKSGYSNQIVKNIEIMPGIINTIRIPGKQRGFRYGWCVEC